MLRIKHVTVCMLALAILSADYVNYNGSTYSDSQVRSTRAM